MVFNISHCLYCKKLYSRFIKIWNLLHTVCSYNIFLYKGVGHIKTNVYVYGTKDSAWLTYHNMGFQTWKAPQSTEYFQIAPFSFSLGWIKALLIHEILLHTLSSGLWKWWLSPSNVLPTLPCHDQLMKKYHTAHRCLY